MQNVPKCQCKSCSTVDKRIASLFHFFQSPFTNLGRKGKSWGWITSLLHPSSCACDRCDLLAREITGPQDSKKNAQQRLLLAKGASAVSALWARRRCWHQYESCCCTKCVLLTLEAQQGPWDVGYSPWKEVSTYVKYLILSWMLQHHIFLMTIYCFL